MTVVHAVNEGLYRDLFALETFGLDLTVPVDQVAQRTCPAPQRFDADGKHPLPYVENWANNRVYPRTYGHQWPGMHEYRMTDRITDPQDGKEYLFFDPARWLRSVNGEMHSYLTCETACVAVHCAETTPDGAPHGNSIMPVRTLFANFNYCWKCLAETLRNQRSGPTCDLSDRARMLWSPLNGPLQPDMVPANSGSINVIWDCPRCGGHWFMAPSGPVRKMTGCPTCSANVSRPEVALWKLLQEVLPDCDVHLGYAIARGESDIALPDYKVIIEYDGIRHHASKAKAELRKDTETIHQGWTTIRVREDGLPPSSHPDVQGRDVTTDTAGRVERAMPRILKQLHDLGVPTPAEGTDFEELRRVLEPEIVREYESRQHATRRH